MQVIQWADHFWRHDNVVKNNILHSFGFFVQIREHRFQLFFLAGQDRRLKLAVNIRCFIFRFLIIAIAYLCDHTIEPMILACIRSDNRTADRICDACIFKGSPISIQDHLRTPSNMAVDPDNKMIVRDTINIVCHHLSPRFWLLVVAADTPPAHIALSVPFSISNERIGTGQHALLCSKSIAAEIFFLTPLK